MGCLCCFYSLPPPPPVLPHELIWFLLSHDPTVGANTFRPVLQYRYQYQYLLLTVYHTVYLPPGTVKRIYTRYRTYTVPVSESYCPKPTVNGGRWVSWDWISPLKDTIPSVSLIFVFILLSYFLRKLREILSITVFSFELTDTNIYLLVIWDDSLLPNLLDTGLISTDSNPDT